MKINSENLKAEIKEVKPNLKDNSIKQYEIHLNKLKKLFETDNYDFLSNPEDVMEKIKGNHYTSQRNTLNAVIILLLALNHDGKYDELIEKYQKIRDKFNDKYQTENENGKISESQKNNFVDLSEIQNMLKEMENKIKSEGLKKKSNLTGKEKELLMVYTIFSFLVRYPLRLDLAGMKYISRTQYNGLSEQDKKDGNYLVHNKKGSQFLEAILNEYKTSKKYGEKKIRIDKDIEKVLRMYIKATGKGFGDVLFVSSTGNPLSRNQLSQLLIRTTKKYLNKSISTTILRKIVVSSTIPKDIIEKQKELADVMGHSVEVQNAVYNKEK